MIKGKMATDSKNKEITLCQINEEIDLDELRRVLKDEKYAEEDYALKRNYYERWKKKNKSVQIFIISNPKDEGPSDETTKAEGSSAEVTEAEGSSGETTKDVGPSDETTKAENSSVETTKAGGSSAEVTEVEGSSVEASSGRKTIYCILHGYHSELLMEKLDLMFPRKFGKTYISTNRLQKIVYEHTTCSNIATTTTMCVEGKHFYQAEIVRNYGFVTQFSGKPNIDVWPNDADTIYVGRNTVKFQGESGIETLYNIIKKIDKEITNTSDDVNDPNWGWLNHAMPTNNKNEPIKYQKQELRILRNVSEIIKNCSFDFPMLPWRDKEKTHFSKDEFTEATSDSHFETAKNENLISLEDGTKDSYKFNKSNTKRSAEQSIDDFRTATKQRYFTLSNFFRYIGCRITENQKIIKQHLVKEFKAKLLNINFETAEKTGHSFEYMQMFNILKEKQKDQIGKTMTTLQQCNARASNGKYFFVDNSFISQSLYNDLLGMKGVCPLRVLQFILMYHDTVNNEFDYNQLYLLSNCKCNLNNREEWRYILGDGIDIPPGTEFFDVMAFSETKKQVILFHVKRSFSAQEAKKLCAQVRVTGIILYEDLLYKKDEKSSAFNKFKNASDVITDPTKNSIFGLQEKELDQFMVFLKDDIKNIQFHVCLLPLLKPTLSFSAANKNLPNLDHCFEEYLIPSTGIREKQDEGSNITCTQEKKENSDKLSKMLDENGKITEAFFPPTELATKEEMEFYKEVYNEVFRGIQSFVFRGKGAVSYTDHILLIDLYNSYLKMEKVKFLISDITPLGYFNLKNFLEKVEYVPEH